MGQQHLFEDGEKVRIKETGEIVTIDHWWFAKPTVDVRLFTAQYNIVEYPGTWFDERELEKVFKYEFVVRDFDLRSASVFLEFNEPLTQSKIDEIIDSYIGVNGIVVCGFVGLVEN